MKEVGGIGGAMKQSNSTRKMEVDIINHPQWGKNWVRITLKNSRVFYPSFEDLYRIVRSICECEDIKYPPPYKGRKFVDEFLHDAVYEKDFEVLRNKYKIPNRNRDHA